MPTKPLSACAEPLCPGRATHRGRCEPHAKAFAAAYEASRPSSYRRGYDSKWRKVRAAYLAQHPICEAEGCQAPAKHVDHIDGSGPKGDNRPSNLQALCASHHSRKTAIYDGGYGRQRR